MPSRDLVLRAALATWPDWAESKPELIGTLDGGLSNSSFLIAVDKMQYVLRINAENSRQLGINREWELQAMASAAQRKICPKVVVANSDLGFSITEYIDARIWNTDDLKSPANLAKLAKLLRLIHSLDGNVGKLQLSERINMLIESAGYFYGSLKTFEHRIFPIVGAVEGDDALLRLCHNDLLVSNVLETPRGELVAIDWEYASLGHPYFDLAAVIEGQSFPPSQVDDFLSVYLGRPLIESGRDQAQFWRWRVVYCYLDCLWYCAQSATGSEALEYNLERKMEQLDSVLNEVW